VSANAGLYRKDEFRGILDGLRTAGKARAGHIEQLRTPLLDPRCNKHALHVLVHRELFGRP
jgi:hypothetical protein